MGMGPDSANTQTNSTQDFIMRLFNSTRSSQTFTFGDNGISPYVPPGTSDEKKGSDSDQTDDKTEKATDLPIAIPWSIGTGEVIGQGALRILGTVSIFLTIPGDTGYRSYGYKPAPRDLPGFPGAVRVKPKAVRARWRLPNGDIAEWDSQHGEVEVYDKTGKNHKGAYDPDNGKKVKPEKKGRNTKK